VSGDIVERLRIEANEWWECCNNIHLPLIAAADTIEARDAEINRLRAEAWGLAQDLAFMTAEVDKFAGENYEQYCEIEQLRAERALADQLAVALAAQGSASFDENTNLNIKKLALEAYKDARGIGNADAADVEGHP
jgi:hypothetical protein